MPVTVRAGDGSEVRVLVDGKADVSVPGCNAGADQCRAEGYFRTQYSPAQFKTLSAGFSKLPVVDQMGVMMDASARWQRWVCSPNRIP